MTLLTTLSEIEYAGLLGQDTFAYPFRVDNKTDMNVHIDTVPVAQGDFTMTGLGDANGGTVILNTPLVADATVLLFREVPLTQEVDYQPFDAFPAETHEGALDKLTMITQQNAADVSRSLRYPEGDTASPLLPDIPTREAKYLSFDSSGNVLMVSGTSTTPGSLTKPAGAVQGNLMVFGPSEEVIDTGLTTEDLRVPVGGIIMFSGTIASLSAQWQICDGTGLTPDLTDTFVLCTNTQGEIGDTGGSANAVVVSHSHGDGTLTAGTSGSTHSHNLDRQTSIQLAGSATTYMQGTGTANNNVQTSTTVSGSHTHTVTGSTATTGVSATDANIPPYYKLAYIMRIS